MDNPQGETIKKELDYLETDDLLDIWKRHDLEQWTQDAFDSIYKILLERNIEIPPMDDIAEAKAHLKQAEDYLEAEDHYKALSHCNMAIQLAPHYGHAYYLKGLVYDEMDKLDEAVKFYQEALQLSPNMSDAKQNLKWALDDLDQEKPQPEERILAALSHGSILISSVGILVPILVWITRKEKTRYVAFQSLQAILFQLIGGGITFIRYLASYIASTTSPLFYALSPSVQTWLKNITGVALVLDMLILITGISGAIITLRGKPFQYPCIGRIVHKFTRS